MPYLILKHEEKKLKTYRLNPSGRIRIGRAEKNEIAIDDTAVSTLHAEIEPEGEHFYLTDFNSRNGTFVNKELVISRRLSHGDVISLGNHTLLFAYGKDEKKPASYENADQQATMQLDTEEHRARLARSVAEFAEQGEKGSASALLSFLSKELEPVRLNKDETFLGKDQGCDIRVRGWRVDKTEAKIEKRPDGYYVCPVAGKPRIKLNYQAVKSEVKLKEFDVIELGDTMIQFHY
ncbi:MAG: FHA domain-containing protein [Desulfobacteraceae bacterium]|nr:FHA domain-containing protein [Desulfobacteraceae bacterium]MCF8094610.1 FHA domain-containing protein [Desulfobacteraceae bacterium]